MVYNGNKKKVIYDEVKGRYHVTRYVTQGNWENICDFWFDSWGKLIDWANG